MRMARRGAVAAQRSAGDNFETTYTGAHTKEIVTHGGMQWEQWTLTGDGVLKVIGKLPACRVWMCGAGAGGKTAYSGNPPSTSTAGDGGGGGYVLFDYAYTLSGNIEVTIGQGGAAEMDGGATTFGDMVANGGKGKNGGSGGAPLGVGAGITTFPFSDNVTFSGKAHCAGGGQGGLYRYPTATKYQIGGIGGTNGSDGGNTTGGSSGSTGGGAGGSYGGGRGGAGKAAGNGVAASFYGGGGGGGGFGTDNGTGTGGKGYQGVVYIRVPLTA